MTKTVDLKSINEPALLKLYAKLMEELRRRSIIRSGNSPVADYAEKVAAEYLALRRVDKEERGYDATDEQGKRYQIKGRRITRHNASRQLGVIRNLDEKLFDYLIAVIFDEMFNVHEIWKIPYAFVKQHSRWSEHVHGHIFHANPNILASGVGIEDVRTQVIRTG